MKTQSTIASSPKKKRAAGRNIKPIEEWTAADRDFLGTIGQTDIVDLAWKHELARGEVVQKELPK